MTDTILQFHPLRALARRLGATAARLRATWSDGPVPCWTEYLRETRG